jgi:hypothetical protein
MYPPNTPTHGANQQAADSENKQIKFYEIRIPAQGKSGRPAKTIPVVIFRAKHRRGGKQHDVQD